MIYEITGQPGHGKTLYGLKLALDFAKEGRVVYAHGVKDLSYEKTGFLRLDDPMKWADVPDNSVILIDECYSAFPNRNPASPVPLYIEPLARHRHRGLDIILIHQQPNQVDPYVRGLVHEHYHVRRKFGFKAAVIKTWDHSSPSPIKDAPLSSPTWRYDKKLYDLYTSATMHTAKRRVPWQLYVALPIIGWVAYTGYRLTSGEVLAGSPTGSGTVAAGATPPGGVPAVRSSDHTPSTINTPEDWGRRFVPRIAWEPGSAPAWDGRQPASIPKIACMIGGRSGCLCLTDQGTKWPMPDQACRAAVESGGAYDYFKSAGGSTRKRASLESSGGPLQAAGLVK